MIFFTKCKQKKMRQWLDLTDSNSSDESNTLFSLKKELESERLKTVTLKTQLETEKNMGRQVQEKHRVRMPSKETSLANFAYEKIYLEWQNK